MTLYIYRGKSTAIPLRLIHQSGLKLLWRDSRRLPPPGSTIINWGRSAKGIDFYVKDYRWINDPYSISLSSNKLRSFKCFEQNGVRTVPFTESFEVAEGWLRAGDTVVARTMLTGHSGQGIVMCSDWETLDNHRCALYTKYLPDYKEYRVHVFGNEVRHVAKKLKLSSESVRERGLDLSNADYRIKNTDNGYIFATRGVNIPERFKEVCINAIRSVRLDFGCVDLLVSPGGDSCYVLETNSAPNIKGQTTSEVYGRYFKQLQEA